jgi:ribosome-associated protein
MTEVSEKKDVQKLQRTIVDSLEDVKAQDIQVFNTEHLSPLFERVVIACGTSNRQTKALASNLRDDVRDAGFGKPRIEGEENGEWIIVDCGAVVVHIMQPTIRQYYHLEEIWGDKPVRIKLGAAKPQAAVKAVAIPKEAPKKAARQPAKKVAAKKASDPKVSAQKEVAKKGTNHKPVAKKPAAKSASAKKPAAKKSPPRKSKP